MGDQCFQVSNGFQIRLSHLPIHEVDVKSNGVILPGFEQEFVNSDETNYCFWSENQFHVKIVKTNLNFMPSDVIPVVFQVLFLFLLWQILFLPKLIKILK